MQRISVFMYCVVTILFSLAGQAQQAGSQSSASAQAQLSSTPDANALQPGMNPPPATITGSGTANHIPRWTGSTTLGDSVLYQTAGRIGVGTTSPTVALDVNGRVNALKSYRIGGTDVLSLPGCCTDNTAVGVQALQSLTSNGRSNTAIGYFAMQANTSGTNNTASGLQALEGNTTGGFNTADGYAALATNKGGDDNTAAGAFALANNTGTENTANGYLAMTSTTTGKNNTASGAEALNENTTGSNNIGIGYQAALNVGGINSNNIHIGNTGVFADSGTIRIGTIATQASFFVAGVSGVTTGLNNAVPIVIDSNGQLGTISSSRRFKEDIQEMGEASQGLMRLRPVTFRYQKAFSDGSKPVQYGLIAEEVEEVYPDLVAHSADGQVETVKYQVLDSMLLNEVQRQQKEIRVLEERLAKMEAALASAEHTPDK